MFRKLIFALAVSMLSAGATCAQQGSEGAEGFVRQVYATYSASGDGIMGERVLDTYWRPDMAALIRRDRALADGDLPYLDADPICDCQDWENLTVRRVEISQFPLHGREGRRADVWFINGGQAQHVILHLRETPTRWRIQDVLREDGGPSLAEQLAESNQRIERGGRAGGRG